MRWFEYKAEVDALHAPDELKERLRAMKNAAPAAKPAAKKPVRFPAKRLAGMAACFVCGAVTVALGGGVLFGSFAMGGASAAPKETGSALQSTAAMNPGAAAGGSFEYKESSDLASDAVLYSAKSWLDGASSTNGAAMRPALPTPDTELKNKEEPGESRLSTQARKIIYTATVTLETTEYDATLQQLHSALEASGGYIEHSENFGYGTDRRRVSYTLRVPAGNYHSFLAAAEATGSLLEKVEDSQDITAAYVDVTARIDTLITQRDRLQQLSAQAESLTDLLDIEEKLSQVQYELESWQRRLNAYDDQVEYCTITATVREVNDYTPVQPTAAQRLMNALTGGFEDFADTLFDLALWVLRNLSWLAVLAVGGGFGLRAWKKRRNK